MSLTTKYQALIAEAKSAGIDDLQIAEIDGVLQIRGTAPSADVKNKLWDIYNQIDPNFLSSDVVMNVDVSTAVAGSKVRVITNNSNLNIRKGPGTDQPIIGKAAKDEIINLISRANDQWWLVRTEDGEEGYCYAQYLEPVE
ncbi:SH3 domain-containing protein [Sphingobacterium hungaricum]|uniref:SH3 domain-containing protein n=1 Tax=Sphingobacterium hungaricum TaxID=2082723 RepID=A0A928V1R5_9SPHI|nr:SH3 domain-containing protein [Sphingobacterium hungaricum]MBE8714917.1 SH3 domain-containing protein [Sphingobacterium hungaricum]